MPDSSDGLLSIDERGGLVLDFSAAREFLDVVEDLERRWLALPPVMRANLSRILWLRPDGLIVPYTTPESDPRLLEAAKDRDADPDPFGLGEDFDPGPPLNFRKG